MMEKLRTILHLVVGVLKNELVICENEDEPESLDEHEIHEFMESVNSELEMIGESVVLLTDHLTDLKSKLAIADQLELNEAWRDSYLPGDYHGPD